MQNDAPQKLSGKSGVAANGHHEYWISDAIPQFLYKAADVLQEKFHFSKMKEPVGNPDHIISECSKDGITLLLGWDIWSGFYVLSDSANADEVVVQIGKYFDSIIQDSAFEQFIYRPN